MQSALPLRGTLGIRKISAPKASLAWRVRNALRPSFILGLLAVFLAKTLTTLTGIPTLTSELRLVKTDKNGNRIDYGVVSRRVVTTAGATAIVNAFLNTFEIELFNYHGVGTGTTAEANGDTALVTESTTALNPDSTRATGTQSAPSATVYKTIGTVTFDATAAITEHGIFSQAATGGGTLLDRSVFAAVNVVSADSIQFTYQLTVNAGG